MSSQLVRRVAVAALAIPAAAGLVYLGGWVLVGTLALLGVTGSREVYRLAAARGVQAVEVLGCTGAALFPVLTFLTLATGGSLQPRLASLALAVWLISVMAVVALTRPAEKGPLATIAVTLLGALYTGALPSFLLLLRHPQVPIDAGAATALAFLPLVTTWVCDTLAMAGGAVIGGPKLAPRLSPGKTWAGAVAGTVGAIAAAPLYGRWVLERGGISIPLIQLLACGLVVATFGQVGDLAESALKREAGVKDSGRLFPGHGGVLDRLDSLYWAVPGVTLVLALGGTL